MGNPQAPVQTANGDWILNPGHTFPLTILKVEQRLVFELRALLGETEEVHASAIYESVGAMVAQTGLRCKEIEDYVSEFRAPFEAGEELRIAPYCDLESLFHGNRLDSPIGASLVAKYGFDNLCFYCRHVKMIGTPRPIPQTHRDRPRFDELVRVGLASMGPSITKGGKSGEAFSLIAAQGLSSVDDLAAWLGFCETVGELLTLTYAHSASATQQAEGDMDPAIREILKGYVVTTTGDDCTCPHCAEMDGKKYSLAACPKAPFHIGCRCTLIADFD